LFFFVFFVWALGIVGGAAATAALLKAVWWDLRFASLLTHLFVLNV